MNDKLTSQQLAYLIACSESAQDSLSHWRYTTNQLVEAITALSGALVTPVVQGQGDMVTGLQRAVLETISGTKHVERGHLDLHQAVVRLLEVTENLVTNHDTCPPDPQAR